MLVGRSLSELGRTLRWTDLRAFISTLGVESNFWRKLAPEETAKAARKAEILQMDNQLLTLIHDAIWDVAYARSGSKESVPRLLNELLAGIESPAGNDTSDKPDRDSKARDVAAEMRSLRSKQ